MTAHGKVPLYDVTCTSNLTLDIYHPVNSPRITAIRSAIKTAVSSQGLANVYASCCTVALARTRQISVINYVNSVIAGTVS